MANPQKENGYIAIATELFEVFLTFKIPSELRRVFDAIIRKTYGFNKKDDYIANSQIVQMTNMKKQNVSRSLSVLITHKLVIKGDYLPKKGNKLGINKDYHDWIPLVIGSDDKKKSHQPRLKKSSRKITKVIKGDDKQSSVERETIDNNQLITNKQKTGTPQQTAKAFFKGISDFKKKVHSEEADQMSQFLRMFSERYPKAEKGALWDEIVVFWEYWTELNKSGTKERWELEGTFQVELRLGRWLRKKDLKSKDSKKSNYSPNKIH